MARCVFCACESSAMGKYILQCVLRADSEPGVCIQKASGGQVNVCRRVSKCILRTSESVPWQRASE